MLNKGEDNEKLRISFHSICFVSLSLFQYFFSPLHSIVKIDNLTFQQTETEKHSFPVVILPN